MRKANALIPRNVLLAPGARSAPALSPRGTSIAFLAPYQGAQNIWLAPAADPGSARPVTAETVSSIRWIAWSAGGEHLILLRDRLGSEQSEAFSFHLESGTWNRLSPREAGETRFAAISAWCPNEIVLEINDRDPSHFDLWRVDIRTGRAQMVFENHQFTWMHVDFNLRPRLGEFRRDDGSVDYYVAPPAPGSEWRPLIHVPASDEALTRPFRLYETLDAFGPNADEIYAMDTRGRDTAALAAWDLETGDARYIAGDDRADAVGILVDRKTGTPVAWTLSYERPETRVLDREAGNDLAALESELGTIFCIVDQSADSRIWLAETIEPERPPQFSLFDRQTKTCRPLYGSHPTLARTVLCRTGSHVIRARDGLELVCYLTLPRNDTEGPGPMVVLIHGGPWIRDDWVFDPWVQLLADRGYRVLTVNYRGSKGFGKRFLSAGDREWGGKMFDDVLDAVDWAIGRGAADPDRIGLMGASFGGYSVLIGLTREPERFACGIDMFGASDLESFLHAIPPYWKAFRTMWDRRLGNIDDPDDLRMIRERSPLNSVGRMRRPLLIAQGGADPRVPKAESDQMAAALEAQGAEVSYLLFDDEGHNFYQQKNHLSFFACVEAFLAKHLGGRAEPMGEEFAGTSLEAPIGASRIPGLTDALTSRR